MKKRALSLLLAVMILLFIPLIGCDFFNNAGFVKYVKTPIQIETTKTEEALWDKTVRQYLSQQLWMEDEAYDAGHHLMVALHAAFAADNQQWIDDFSAHFHRFVEATSADPECIVQDRLHKLHYLYLCSRFLLLAHDYGRAEVIPSGMYDYVYDYIETLWVEEPAWWYEPAEFEGGIRERILYKLEHHDVEYSYYRAIVDEDIFTMAIAADLYSILRQQKNTPADSLLLEDILETAFTVFDQEGVFLENGGWLFQPGAFSDHPDDIYAGHTKVSPDLQPSKIEGLAWDTSHSHRMSLWLTSFIQASDTQEKKDGFIKMKAGLNRQFFSVVVVLPSEEYPFYRTTNFMDGHNGVYRYLNSTTPMGYDPYELSGTITIGLWCFLGSPEATQMYDYIYHSYPLTQDAIDCYVGPNTSRSRNAFVTLPDFYQNGMGELIASLACKISDSLSNYDIL